MSGERAGHEDRLPRRLAGQINGDPQRAHAGPSGVVPNLIVTRDRMPVDLPTDAAARMNMLIDRQVAQMERQLAGFSIVSRRADSAGTRRTGELKVDWESAQAALTQGLTFVDAGEGVLMIATGTAGRGEYGEHESTFRQMLQSFRIE